MTGFLKVVNLTKTYQNGPKRLTILDGFNMTLEAGELLGVVGRSGSGKTTLLNLICGLDRPDSGEINFQNQELTRLKPATWDQIRQRDMGVVFQFNQLLPEFSALENVMMPGWIARREPKALEAGARDLLVRVGMQDRLDHRPSQLSGGEQQRVAFARALVNGPKLLLMDEPTGSLDPNTGKRVFAMLKELQKVLQVACILVTHNPDLADMCDRICDLDSKGPNGSRLI